ncbi:hypothetical protein BHM03_00018037, partial [Ensete ventricosum]
LLALSRLVPSAVATNPRILFRIEAAMEKIPAACAMAWSIELEKGLRSKSRGRSSRAAPYRFAFPPHSTLHRALSCSP